VRERALTFGPDGILVGVLTEPDPEVALPNAPAHVILNSGIIHRVGSSRIYVTLARAAAKQGFSTLRFDFSGVGDSGTRRDSIPIEERFVAETQEAMEYMARVTGAERFVVGGLCSGADGAFWAGIQDERIDGIWQIDPFTYRTPRYYLRRYGPKLVDPRAWLHSIKVRFPDRNGEAEDEVFVAPEYRRVFPPRKVVHDGLKALLDRDVALYVFLTGDSDLNYPGQFAAAFPRLRLAERSDIRYVPDAVHTVTGLEHQTFLERDLVDWMVRNWRPEATESTAGSPTASASA
jgi:hypothetical protein